MRIAVSIVRFLAFLIVARGAFVWVDTWWATVLHGLDPVNVKRWSGHSKASMLTDVYSHVVTDPDGDEWREFWLDAYAQQTRPRVAKRRSGVVSVWSQEEAAA